MLWYSVWVVMDETVVNVVVQCMGSGGGGGGVRWCYRVEQ